MQQLDRGALPAVGLTEIDDPLPALSQPVPERVVPRLRRVPGPQRSGLRLGAEQPEAATVQLEIVKRTGRLRSLAEEVTQSVLGEYGLTYADFDVLATLRRAGTPYRLKPGRAGRQGDLTRDPGSP
ncbi:hypothetical protein FHR32_000501 [Streptosporangium album]|uniref:Uncharacterized protein n=1 Tax=Streptosporangium album TaxID=47479 RepID=A0A7W7W6W8_9ACTN|nr:hypothetical protein [Streptosporangium album]MBB4936196.1 hypothetical protein [Streptosporangium album]